MEPGNGRTVVVGMSGGVDSAVAALLLKEQGWRPIGLFMKNWEEKDSNGRCTSEADWEDVLRVCDSIDIPCYSVNFVQEYQENVFSHFLRELEQGHTPNPDILCNREIKFKVLLDKALAMGGEYLATGHYCQKGGSAAAGWQLQKGSDPGKDQSYFLCAVPQHAISRALFPLGGVEKKVVRQIATRAKLPVAEKKDSTGICFIGKRDFKQFIKQYLPYVPGDIVTADGRVLGSHDGVAYYTIGQRHGLGIGGEGEAWFVADKDIERNQLIAVQGTNHPALFRQRLCAAELSWVAGTAPAELPYECSAKVRYRQPEQLCVITAIDAGVAHVVFAEPQRAVTLRQAVAFYQGSVCLGGGFIVSSSI